jgi:tetratricopeptide (TPR) repeat protein
MKLFIITVLLSTSLYAQKTRKVMDQTMDNLVALVPYLQNELKFKQKKNEKEIQKYLELLVSSLKNAKHVEELNKPGFTPSFKIIKDNLEEALFSFQHSNKDFARLRINSSMGLCMSCHSQLPEDLFSGYILNTRKVNRKSFNSAYEYANFLLILRKYEDSLTNFIKYIEDSAKKKDNYYFSKSLDNAFQKILVINTKILKDPKKALSALSKVQKIAPSYLKEDIDSWIKDLKEWDKGKMSQYLKKEKMKVLLEKTIKDVQDSDYEIGTSRFDVNLLMASGIGSNYMRVNPKSELSGSILYIMALADYSLNHDIFYNLGDHYLQTCIDRYAKKDIAKKCYGLYEEEIKFRYTGSLGTKLPSKVKEKLKFYKAKLK